MTHTHLLAKSAASNTQWILLMLTGATHILQSKMWLYACPSRCSLVGSVQRFTSLYRTLAALPRTAGSKYHLLIKKLLKKWHTLLARLFSWLTAKLMHSSSSHTPGHKQFNPSAETE
jgi:hypothetical protein